MTTPVIEARGLRKAYKNKLALDNTAFDIPAGRIVGLIGPNGADHARLGELGETRTPGLADLFVATMKGTYA